MTAKTSNLPTRELLRAMHRRTVWQRMRGVPIQIYVGGAILLMYVFLALAAGWLAPYPPNEIGTGLPFATYSNEHLLGTDQLGRDVFSRVLFGTRWVLLLSISGTAVGLVLGALVGLLAGYLNGWFDELVMRIGEAFISIPFIVLALIIMAAVGPKLGGSPFILILVIGVVYAPRIARMARAVALDLSTREYVTAAKMRGESALSIVVHELLPNATGTLLVEFAVRAGYAPVLIGSLGFLGFGVKPPTPEWGRMISENRQAIVAAPITVLGPGLALALLVVGLNLCTEGIARIVGRSAQREP